MVSGKCFKVFDNVNEALTLCLTQWQNRRTKWKKQDGISNTEAADYKVGGDKRPKDQSMPHKTKTNKSIKNNANGNSGAKTTVQSVSATTAGQTSSCSQTSDETVKNISHNSNSSSNSSVKNDVTDGSHCSQGSDPLNTRTNKLNANYDIELKSEIDESDSTSPRSLRIAEHDKDESLCFDDDDDNDQDDHINDSKQSGSQREHSISLSHNNDTQPEDKCLNGEQKRVFRIESSDQNPITKTFISDSLSLWEATPQLQR